MSLELTWTVGIIFIVTFPSQNSEALLQLPQHLLCMDHSSSPPLGMESLLHHMPMSGSLLRAGNEWPIHLQNLILTSSFLDWGPCRVFWEAALRHSSIWKDTSALTHLDKREQDEAQGEVKRSYKLTHRIPWIYNSVVWLKLLGSYICILQLLMLIPFQKGTWSWVRWFYSRSHPWKRWWLKVSCWQRFPMGGIMHPLGKGALGNSPLTEQSI